MRVIGAGFGRTGTTSLKAALGELGFGPSYGLGEVFRNPEHVGFWKAAGLAGEEADWVGFLADYEVAVDWPACSCGRALSAAASRTGITRWGSSSATTRRSAAASLRRGC